MLPILIHLLLGIHVLVSVLIVLIVLMQRPKSEGLGAAFGGGMTENLFGAQTSNVLAGATRWLGGIFFGLTLLLAILYAKQSQQHSTIQEKAVAEAAVMPPAIPSGSPVNSPSPAPGSSPAAAPAKSGTAEPMIDLSGSGQTTSEPSPGSTLLAPQTTPAGAFAPATTLSGSSLGTQQANPPAQAPTPAAKSTPGATKP